MRKVSEMESLLCAGVLALITEWPVGAALAAGPELQVPIGQRQLFMDDYGIASIENLDRTMHQPAKKGAVLRPDPAKGGSFQIRSAPLWDPKEEVFKFLVADTYGPKSRHLWYISVDGLHWTAGRRPSIRGSKVVYDGQDPNPARRYKAAMPPDGFAVSPDGITWTKTATAGIPSSDEHNFSLDQKDHQFLVTVKIGGPYGRSHGVATSKDFEHWTNHGLIFHADDLDQKLGRERIKAYLADPTRLGPLPEHQANYTVDVYNFGLFRYEGLYIGLPAMHHRFTHRPPRPLDDTFFHVIQLTCSRDLKNWTRLGDRQPWIDVSRLGSGAYDSKCILPPSSAVVRGPGCLGGADKLSKDQLWFYYMAGKAGVEMTPDGFAICLAILRRDGFVSLDAGQKAGAITTKPFTVRGKKLFVNVDASKGEIRADVLDGRGKVLAASTPMKGDLSRGQVKWSSGNIAARNGKVVRIRFSLRNARFYSYWFE